jgi:hypothetical protein
MAIATVTDGLWELLQPLLPTTPRRFRFPGRRRLDHRQVLNGILYVLAHRDRLGPATPTARLRFGNDLLAAPAGLEPRRGMGPAPPAAPG